MYQKLWRSDYYCIIDNICINFAVINSIEICSFKRIVKIVYTCNTIKHIKFSDQNHFKLGLQLMEKPFTKYNLEQFSD